MIPVKTILKIFPWALLLILVAFLYISGHWPFKGQKKEDYHIINSSSVLHEIESLGKMELVKYNFREILDYNKLSSSKMIGNAILNTGDFSPDLSVVLIASGEAVGCIDLTKLVESDIVFADDTLSIQMPAPELCYHKLDLQNTRIHRFTRSGWWIRLFGDEEEENALFQQAYRNAEAQIELAALESGILENTKLNAQQILQPMLEKMTGKYVHLYFPPEISFQEE